jgi:hypothetical protein
LYGIPSIPNSLKTRITANVKPSATERICSYMHRHWCMMNKFLHTFPSDLHSYLTTILLLLSWPCRKPPVAGE